MVNHKQRGNVFNNVYSQVVCGENNHHTYKGRNRARQVGHAGGWGIVKEVNGWGNTRRKQGGKGQPTWGMNRRASSNVQERRQ